MRLGSYPAKLIRGTVTAESYGTLDVTERHRHRYEVNNAYRDKIAPGLVFGHLARRPAGRVRGVPARPPSVPGGHRLIRSSRADRTRPHPLFRSLIESSLKYKSGRTSSG